MSERAKRVGTTRGGQVALALTLGLAVAVGMGADDCGSGGDGPVTCEKDGVTYLAGEDVPSDDCNTCFCTDTGSIACTKIGCIEQCVLDDGTVYEVGDVWDMSPGCAECECLAGGQAWCSKKPCLCNPETEWWRDYKGDPETCKLIKFACPESTSYFSNSCGCGCEQSAKCPEVITCSGAISCDLDAMAAQCPFSEVDPGLPTNACTAEQGCVDMPFAMCFAPGESIGCGICYQPDPSETCATDAACATGQICEWSKNQCTCSGEKLCIPGCASDSDCGQAEQCGADYRCHGVPCASSPDCGADHACVANTCERASCKASSDCDGYCVKGKCYATPGFCSPPPA